MKHMSPRNISLGPGVVLALLFLCLTFETALADRPVRRSGPLRQFSDQRYNHNRSYPIRDQYVRRLPRDRRAVIHGGSRFYFSSGVWYRPYASRYVVTAPPIGLFVPFLPPYYATVWAGGIPYYYANDVYYTHRGNGYVVVDPPAEGITQTPPPADQMFIYPRMGQSEQQQADDRFACHQWAVQQTGFDPTQPAESVGSDPSKRVDYQRAMGACLDGRGYTVK